jgi:hypothetical protein
MIALAMLVTIQVLARAGYWSSNPDRYREDTEKGQDVA